MTVYSASKAFMFHFSKSLRYELKPRGINVCAVCPGPMETDFLDVADIPGNSKAFATLPYCDPAAVAGRALEYARAGRGVYTPRLFYKFYRLLANGPAARAAYAPDKDLTRTAPAGLAAVNRRTKKG